MASQPTLAERTGSASVSSVDRSKRLDAWSGLRWVNGPARFLFPYSWRPSISIPLQHVSQTLVWDTSERHHGPERSDSRGEDLLALLAQLALRPDVPVERHGVDPSSRQSSDAEVSRCAIAAWASRTWVFDSANFLPPWRPCARNADAHEFLTARHQT